MIISHHGQYEFGSPKLPMFPEALLLHYLDNLDSKLQSMQALLERHHSGEGDWTGFLPSLGRPLLDLHKFLQGSGKPTAESASPTPNGPDQAKTPGGEPD